MLESQPEVKLVKFVNLYLYRPVTNRPIQFAYQPAAAGTFLLIEGILDKGKAGGRKVISGRPIVFHRKLLSRSQEVIVRWYKDKSVIADSLYLYLSSQRAWNSMNWFQMFLFWVRLNDFKSWGGRLLQVVETVCQKLRWASKQSSDLWSDIAFSPRPPQHMCLGNRC